MGPPEGSYLDALVDRYGCKSMFALRAPFATIRTWWENREHRLRLEQELAVTRAKTAASPSFTFSYDYQRG